MRLILTIFCILALQSCAPQTQELSQDRLRLEKTSFSALPGWENESHLQGLVAFRHSCRALLAAPKAMEIDGHDFSWEAACTSAQRVFDDEAAARAYFEQTFDPFETSGNDGAEGLFTGYYAPQLNGFVRQSGAFQTPLYRRPTDLIEIDFGGFKSALAGQHSAGKVSGQHFVPYDCRAEIVKGSLAGRAQPLVWVDDPIAAFFLEIQGSGEIVLPDGSSMWVGYDGSNGRSYTALGKSLADRGEIDRPVTMPKIREWLEAHPDQAETAMDENESYVFFRDLPAKQPLGAEGVELTPLASLAVDNRFIPYGVPIWLDSLDAHGKPFQRLMIAQDKGGAIKGTIRGDVYWGSGAEAQSQAGAMQSRGRYFLLLPKEGLR